MDRHDPLAPTLGDAATSLVRLRVHVYDVLGQVVRRLDIPSTDPGGWLPAGEGSIKWNGRDDDGDRVLPGLYHFRVQATDQARQHGPLGGVQAVPGGPLLTGGVA